MSWFLFQIHQIRFVFLIYTIYFILHWISLFVMFALTTSFICFDLFLLMQITFLALQETFTVSIKFNRLIRAASLKCRQCSRKFLFQTILSLLVQQLNLSWDILRFLKKQQICFHLWFYSLLSKFIFHIVSHTFFRFLWHLLLLLTSLLIKS